MLRFFDAVLGKHKDMKAEEYNDDPTYKRLLNEVFRGLFSSLFRV